MYIKVKLNNVVNIIESTKNEFEKDLKNLKYNVNKFYRNFYDKFKIESSNLYNEEEVILF